MEVLYPKDYVITAKAEEPTVKDTTKLEAFIKNLIKDVPVSVHKIIELVDAEYVKTNDEDMHFLAQDITAVCEAIDKEYRPEGDAQTLPEVP